MSIESLDKSPNQAEAIDYIGKAREAILGAPSEIEREYRASRNPWVSCLFTQMTPVKVLVHLAFEKKIINADKYHKIDNKLKHVSDIGASLLALHHPRILESGEIDKDGGVTQEAKSKLLEEFQSVEQDLILK